ncbi:MAG: polysulfide reductase NrfD [Chloroflexi bacterium]|nr:polysulfide reductase NrfD [Chloroflexota bacterium]MBV9601629.1 polysulfide reductase NrfD [Chloroflexota bacterium]
MPPEFNPSFQVPNWSWWIVLYFFFGGITGGTYFAAAWLDLFGDARDRAAIWLGHLLTFPLLVLCTAFLIVDLGQPLRFWHMLLQSERLPLPMFKAYSPMSFGSVILAVFGLVAFVSFVDALLAGRDGRLHAPGNPIGKIVAAIGAVGGLALAGYTGVLVNVTNLPVWSTSPWLGMLFLFSGVSTGIAFLLLIARRYPSTTIEKLEEADNYMMILESIALVLFLLGLGVIGSRFILGNPPVLALFLVVIVVGLAVPFALRFIPRRPAAFAGLASVCVLVGGFVLRWAVLAGPQGVGL